jgi:UDP-glucose 4-epimerase
LENLKNGFNFRYELIFFYNVYGPRQIKTGSMATVIGIFEDHYKKKKPLPVVLPGTQTRRFTHIDDTIKVCFKAWKQNKNRFYSVTNKESFKIIEVAKMFKTSIKFLPPRKGERYASALSSVSFSNTVHKNFGKISLRNYLAEFLKTNK